MSGQQEKQGREGWDEDRREACGGSGCDECSNAGEIAAAGTANGGGGEASDSEGKAPTKRARGAEGAADGAHHPRKKSKNALAIGELAAGSAAAESQPVQVNAVHINLNAGAFSAQAAAGDPAAQTVPSVADVDARIAANNAAGAGVPGFAGVVAAIAANTNSIAALDAAVNNGFAAINNGIAGIAATSRNSRARARNRHLAGLPHEALSALGREEPAGAAAVAALPDMQPPAGVAPLPVGAVSANFPATFADLEALTLHDLNSLAVEYQTTFGVVGAVPLEAKRAAFRDWVRF